MYKDIPMKGNPYRRRDALAEVRLESHKGRDETRVDENHEHHPGRNFETPTRLRDFCVDDFHESQVTDRKRVR